MSFFKAMSISASALNAERIRMNVLSSNMANAQTTRTNGPGSGPYKRQDVIFSAIPTGDSFEDLLDESSNARPSQVKVVQIHEDTRPPREVFDPSHPDADENGNVKMPNINIVTEMVNMIAATRAFEANVTAINDAKQTALKALEIGA